MNVYIKQNILEKKVEINLFLNVPFSAVNYYLYGDCCLFPTHSKSVLPSFLVDCIVSRGRGGDVTRIKHCVQDQEFQITKTWHSQPRAP